MSRIASPENDPAYKAGGFALALALAAILTALGYEHIGGLEPCPLCLQQRWAFYAGIPALFVALGGGSLLHGLEKTRVVRCDEAAWRFLGLSFAGWNVVGSFLIFVASLQAAFGASDRTR